MQSRDIVKVSIKFLYILANSNVFIMLYKLPVLCILHAALALPYRFANCIFLLLSRFQPPLRPLDNPTSCVPPTLMLYGGV